LLVDRHTFSSSQTKEEEEEEEKKEEKDKEGVLDRFLCSFTIELCRRTLERALTNSFFCVTNVFFFGLVPPDYLLLPHPLRKRSQAQTRKSKRAFSATVCT
jgi:hypothetical protein